MGRLLAILLLIQISLPGFCCLANRAVRSAAYLIGLSSGDGSLHFLGESCCSYHCCTPSDGKPGCHPTKSEPGDCCTTGHGCCSTSSASDSSPTDPLHDLCKSNRADESGQQNPGPQKACECLDAEPMIPPSMASLNIDADYHFCGACLSLLNRSSRFGSKNAHYHPPPIRRHLFLCVIRC